MINNIFNFIILIFGIISIVIATGIVWRVEKRLDISYKFLQIAIIVFSVGIVLDILISFGVMPAWHWSLIVKLLFVVFFLLGVFEMRILVRHLDDELPPEKNSIK